MNGLHDDPRIYPTLPGKAINQKILDFTPPRSEYRNAWEYVLSHDLTDRESAAFWHGVSIQSAATRRVCGGDGR